MSPTTTERAHADATWEAFDRAPSMSWFDGAIQLIAPTRCAGCDEQSEAPFCGACESLLEPAGDHHALYRYGGPVADAIRRFKYGGRSELGAVLGGLMGEHAARWRARVDAVVPVPLHWRRRRMRGFDQAALLAIPVARSLGIPPLLRGLRRVRHTRSQVELPYLKRQQNMRGAFAPWALRGARKVLLVDDVRTTGATLAAASRALREGGVSEIAVLVLATRVLDPAT